MLEVNPAQEVLDRGRTVVGAELQVLNGSNETVRVDIFKIFCRAARMTWKS